MYSPAERPSSIRAAPAKNLIWSTIGGISSDKVSAIGLPVFCDSAATSWSALASIVSAIRSSARLRSDGVASRQPSKASAAERERSVDLVRAGDWRGGEGLAGGRVDQVGTAVEGDVGPLPADEVAQIVHHAASVSGC